MSSVDSYGPYAAIVTIIGILGYNHYRYCNPSIDDLKQRAIDREHAGSCNVRLGADMMAMENKQLDWERRCLEANKILEKS